MTTGPRQNGITQLRYPGWLLCIMGLAWSNGAAADNAHPMRFDNLSRAEGLSQSAVISIEQDSRGFMWFGTENGLNRFDGYEFEQFRRERGNDDALKNDFIFDVANAKDGGLWIATNGGGLAYYDPGRNTFRSYRHDERKPGSITGNIVRTLLVDADGSVWLGLRNAGLDRFSPRTGTFIHYELRRFGDGAAAPESVFALHKDSSGKLWVGGEEGLYRLNPATGVIDTFRHDAADESTISDNRIRAVYEDADGNLWVGTYGGGLNRFEAETGGFVRYRHDADDPASLSNDRVTTLLQDSAGRMWVGTAGGLNLMDTDAGTFVRYYHEGSATDSLASDAIAALHEDRGGMLWVGTLTGGVSKWNPHTWRLGLEQASTLAAAEDERPNVTSFASDGNGTVWIGTFGDGLNALDRSDGSITRYRHDPADPASISDNRVMSLMLDRSGKLWIGTMSGGLNRLDPESGDISVFRHEPGNPRSLAANGVMSIFEDSRGAVWVGTFGGGVSRYDAATGTFTNFAADRENPRALSSPRVTSFAEGPGGEMWIGTDAGGLNLLDRDSGHFHRFRHDPDDAASIASDTVYSLHVDANGTVWVGTNGGGLDRVVGSPDDPAAIRFSNLSQNDGLSNDVIYGVQSDADGRLWLSTNYGISRVDPKTGSIRNLHQRDGLQAEEFNFGAHHASPSGELLFGGIGGYNIFDPATIEQSSAAPPVVLTGYFKSNEPVRSDLPADLDQGIELSYRDDTVRFEFAALDFAAPSENRYRYKLEGFDRDWIDLGTRRRATYTDLDDGNYLLRVQAANSDGVWNETGVSLPVRVKPAPWHTWWAYAGYAAMLLQIILFFGIAHRRKMRREAEYKQRLEKEVRDRTQEIAERNEELRKLNRSLQESSLSDPLTGLRNRRFVFEEVSRDLATISRKYKDERDGLRPEDAADLVFMMIDLDNFKPINDTYGHAAGDQLLLDIRDVLLKTCRRSDFVIRWGGDEFVVIAKQAHRGESEALAERIRHEIADRKFVLGNGTAVSTTCSIGFVSFPLFRGQTENADLDDVINLADNLMYEAKRQRNAWVGMLGINEAVTSEGFDIATVEPSSLLFRARRAGRIFEHSRNSADSRLTRKLSQAG